MKIGTIGAGHIGGTLARLLAAAGHEIAISNSSGSDSLKGLAAKIGPMVHAAAPSEAAAFGEVVIVSIPFGHYRSLPAHELAGKIVIDTNNYYPDRDGLLAELDSGRSTSSEMLQAHLPQARVVKAFNTNYARVLREGARPIGAPDRIAVPIAGDEDAAKKVVSSLVDEIGFDPVDVGSLAEGRKLQPGSPVYTRPLTAGEVRKELRLD
jgi:8-hydroxy-5-deazaflavin:NADPH oxidoreductase